ncbi:hypothetical protein SDJN03_00583, partial [Cucurbita argyrosperma subsp. sororia]
MAHYLLAQILSLGGDHAAIRRGCYRRESPEIEKRSVPVFQNGALPPTDAPQVIRVSVWSISRWKRKRAGSSFPAARGRSRPVGRRLLR